MSEIIKKAKGRIKQAVGGLTGDHALQQKGAQDEREGQIEGAVGEVRHAVTGVVKDVKAAIRKAAK